MNKILDFFNLNKNAMSATDIHQEMVSNINYGLDNLIILASAIIIASIGLNTNSIAVIIGAMLISPIMGPLLTLSYSISTSNRKLLYSSFKMLIIYIVLAITMSTIFFNISYIKAPTSELIARTNPDIFALLIAFFGGITGIIGVTRKTKGNVIPGVAIATALMPPLCTVGYGIANHDITYITNAFILFLTNAYLIVLTSMGILKIMKLYRKSELNDEKKKDIKKITLVIFWIVFIPALLNTFITINQTNTNAELKTFIRENINNEHIIINDSSINYNTQTIHIQSIGELDNDDKEELKDFKDSHRSINEFSLIIEYMNVEQL